MLFDDLILKLLPQEGEYSDHPSDTGGKTKFGITEKTAQQYGYFGHMKDMSIERATAIYKNGYWEVPAFDRVASISELVAEKLFNAGVNIGSGRVSSYLQKVLNVFNMKQDLYPNLKVDGNIGTKTIESLKLYLTHREGIGENVLIKAMNCLQGEYYISISEKYEKNKDFVFGWLHKRIEI